jgi:uncharacterized protein YqgV (UPF0045/DUF77 family)
MRAVFQAVVDALATPIKARIHAITALVETLVDAIPQAVQARFHALATVIQARVDTIAPAVQALGRPFMASLGGPSGSGVQALVDAVAACVESRSDPLAAVVQTRVDAIATGVETFVHAVTPLVKALFDAIAAVLVGQHWAGGQADAQQRAQPDGLVHGSAPLKCGHGKVIIGCRVPACTQ